MIGLVNAIDEHADAIEYDLIRSGSRLRQFPDDGVSWRDLWVLITYAQPDSAVFKALQGDAWQATPELELLRAMAHTLDVLAWQGSARRVSEYPAPPRFPWDPPLASRPDSMAWDDAMAWLGWVDPTT